MDFVVAAYWLGLGSSALTELMKLIPFLDENEVTRTLTAFAVMTAVTLASIGFDIHAWDWSLFGSVLLWSFVNYKAIVQPIAKTSGLRTQ